jgi:hypothetical protein
MSDREIGGGRTYQKLLSFNFIQFWPFAYLQWQQHQTLSLSPPTNKLHSYKYFSFHIIYVAAVFCVMSLSFTLVRLCTQQPFDWNNVCMKLEHCVRIPIYLREGSQIKFFFRSLFYAWNLFSIFIMCSLMLSLLIWKMIQKIVMTRLRIWGWIYWNESMKCKYLNKFKNSHLKNLHSSQIKYI